MKEIFNWERFSRYTVYEICKVLRENGIRLAAMCFMPTLFVIVFGIFRVIMGGSWYTDTTILRTFLFIAMSIVFVVSFPVRSYGHLTEKKGMSEWLMVPVSSAEKFASMLVNSLIVLPVIYIVGYLVADVLLVLADPASVKSVVAMALPNLEIFTRFGAFLLTAFSFFNCILAFLLGALVFRHSKTAKTIIVLMLISMLMSGLLLLVINSTQNLDFTISAKTFEILATIAAYAGVLIPFAVLCSAIYYRIRTLKA